MDWGALLHSDASDLESTVKNSIQMLKKGNRIRVTSGSLKVEAGYRLKYQSYHIIRSNACIAQNRGSNGHEYVLSGKKFLNIMILTYFLLLLRVLALILVYSVSKKLEK